MRIRPEILFVASTLAMSLTIQGQPIVNADGSAFPITRGMTLRQAIQALKPEYQTYALGGDTGWRLLIHDRWSRDDVVITLWADDSQDYVIDYSAKVTVVTIYSDKYRTRDGVHVGMLVRDVEKKLGKLKHIVQSELTAQGFAEFRKMPEGLEFEIGACLPEKHRRTQEYSANACIKSISVSMW